METNTNNNLVYTDLLYFGYEYEDDSKSNETTFMKEVKEKFPNVQFKDAYDSIKGYRQELFLEESEKDNYFAWILAQQYYGMSFTMQLMMLDPEQKEKFTKYFNLAKSLYPEVFKQD
jgi:hypothetical protein